MKKILIILFLIIFSLPSLSGEVYSNLKQENEYYCGPVSSANTIINLFNLNQPNLVETLANYEKTKETGTTVNNLCKGIDKFLKNNNIKSNISYYGFINADKKYQKTSYINISKLQGQGIINIGIYKRHNKEYVREEGHFVSFIGIADNSIYILDPYSKNNDLETWTFEKQKINLINKDKLETFSEPDECYIITSPIEYLEEGEFAIINGIIMINQE